jgi:Gluconate 2-dehydrogenase subunit 3
MSDEYRKIDRRTVLQLIPASLLASGTAPGANSHCGSTAAANPAGRYQFQFFTPDEVDLFNKVAEAIIPADDHSPGAREAKVVEFADLMVSTSADYVKSDWRSGFQLLAAELQKTDLSTWLDRVSEQEEDPWTVLEIFFRTLKQMTINGYYSSEIGIHQEMRYQGNTYVASFPGCNHPEHQA